MFSDDKQSVDSQLRCCIEIYALILHFQFFAPSFQNTRPLLMVLIKNKGSGGEGDWVSSLWPNSVVSHILEASQADALYDFFP